MTNPDPQLLSLAHESAWRGQARRKLAEDIAADLMTSGDGIHARDLALLDGSRDVLGVWAESALADRIEKHLMGAML